jgi:hypothetical protein
MNERENTKILIDLLRKVKADKSRRVSKNELDHLDKNVKTIKEDVDKGRSVGYIVIGIDSKGRTNHACCGTSFMIEEMLVGLIEQFSKDDTPLVEAILERIKFELDEPNEDKPKDHKRSKEEISEELMNFLCKKFNIDEEEGNEK